MEIWKRQPIPDKIAILILLSIGITALIATQKEDFFISNFQENLAQKDEMGHITTINKDVRIKMLTDNNWSTPSNGSLVFNKQMVFTGPNSTTTIKLTDKSTIELGPESLILLTQKGNQKVLEIKKGEIKGSFKNVSLLHEGKLVKLNSASSQIRVKKKKLEFIHKDKKARVFVEKKFSLKEKDSEKQVIRLANLPTSFFILEDKKVKIPLHWDSKAIQQYIILLQIKVGGKTSYRKISPISENDYILSLSTTGQYQVTILDANSETISSNQIHFEIIDIEKIKVKIKEESIRKVL